MVFIVVDFNCESPYLYFTMGTHTKCLNKNNGKDVKVFRKGLNKASYDILEAYGKIEAE